MKGYLSIFSLHRCPPLSLHFVFPSNLLHSSLLSLNLGFQILSSGKWQNIRCWRSHRVSLLFRLFSQLFSDSSLTTKLLTLRIFSLMMDPLHHFRFRFLGVIFHSIMSRHYPLSPKRPFSYLRWLPWFHLKRFKRKN